MRLLRHARRAHALDGIWIGDQRGKAIRSDISIDERVDECGSESRYQAGETFVFYMFLARLFRRKVCDELCFQRFANSRKIDARIECRGVAGSKRDREAPECHVRRSCINEQ